MRRSAILPLFAAAITLLVFSNFVCHPTRSLQNTSPLPPDWTLEVTPNNLDVVGTVFALKKKQYIYIYTVPLKDTQGIVVVPNNKIQQTVSLGAFLNFLQIKGLDTASLNIGDSTHLMSDFDVSNAAMVRQNDDLLAPFQNPQIRKIIIDNLNAQFLDANDRVYLITDIIKSPSVKIDVDRYADPHLNIALTVSKILSINPNFGDSRTDSTSINYNLKDTLTIFYKLNRINFNLVQGRAPGEPSKISSFDVSTTQEKRADLLH